MKFTAEQQMLALSELLSGAEATIYPSGDDVKAVFPHGAEIEAADVFELADKLLSEDPGAARHPEEIDQVRAVLPDARALCVEHRTWDFPNNSLSKVVIWDGENHHEGNTFEQALAALTTHHRKLVLPFRK